MRPAGAARKPGLHAEDTGREARGAWHVRIPGTLTGVQGTDSIRSMKQADRLHRWTRHEYERLIDHGFLHEDDPVELLDGLLLVEEPQHSAHRTAVILVAKALEQAFGDGWFVQTQSPILLDDLSEPEPDVSVIRGAPRDYATRHPSRPALVVEVADAGLRMARGRKAGAYARAGIAEYWILNLVERVLEIYRAPAGPDADRRRWAYSTVSRLAADAGIVPRAASTAEIRVAALLP
jgi:Uma2 family endonuclease